MPRGKHNNHAKGSRHPRWNSGRIIDSEGYPLVRVGKDHPLADPNGYCREHVLVMSSYLGRPLEPGELVHHKDEDKQDCRIENLDLTERPEHARHHIIGRHRDVRGRFLPKASGV